MRRTVEGPNSINFKAELEVFSKISKVAHDCGRNKSNVPFVDAQTMPTMAQCNDGGRCEKTG